MRIVSLVPSLSHTVCELGLKDQLVGCTSFCVKPTDLHRSTTNIGGTKDPQLDKIQSLNPTHILTNDEENRVEDIAECEKIAASFRCLPRDVTSTVAMIHKLGDFLEQKSSAKKLATSIEQRLDKLRNHPNKIDGNFLYFIWREPYMIAGADSYISRLLELTGLRNANQGEERYPSVTIDAVAKSQIDYLFLATEPYPFRRRDYERMRDEWPGKMPKCFKADGQLLSWWGALTAECLLEMDSYLTKEKSSLLLEW